MELTISVLLALAAFIHLLPLVGAISVAKVEALYDVRLDGPDLAILMRHRAVLFGVLGGLLVAAIVDADLRPAVVVAVLVSDLAFLLLTLVHRGHNAALRRVLVADLISIAALVVAGVLLVR